MQIYHIFTLVGLKLQKYDFLDDPQTDPDPNHYPHFNFFGGDDYDIFWKENHPTLKH